MGEVSVRRKFDFGATHSSLHYPPRDVNGFVFDRKRERRMLEEIRREVGLGIMDWLGYELRR